MSPALAGRFLTTGPLGKSLMITFKTYSVNNFQICNTVLSTLIAMLYIISPWLIYCITGSLNHLSIPLPLLLAGTSLFSESVSSGVCLFWFSFFLFFKIPHKSEIIWYLLFFFWLISLSLMPLRSIHVFAGNKISFFFSGREYSIVCVYICMYVHTYIHTYISGLPWRLRGKESTSNAGDTGSIPGLGRSPGERNGNPLQYSCLGNLMNRGAWRAIVHGVAKEPDIT